MIWFKKRGYDCFGRNVCLRWQIYPNWVWSRGDEETLEVFGDYLEEFD